jgi:transketolase
MGPVLTLAQAGCVPPTAEDNDVGNLGSELAEAAVATAPTVRSLVVRWIPESGRPADDVLPYLDLSVADIVAAVHDNLCNT